MECTIGTGLEIDQNGPKETAATIVLSTRNKSPRPIELSTWGMVLLFSFLDVKNGQFIGQVMSCQGMVVVNHHSFVF